VTGRPRIACRVRAEHGGLPSPAGGSRSARECGHPSLRSTCSAAGAISQTQCGGRRLLLLRVGIGAFPSCVVLAVRAASWFQTLRTSHADVIRRPGMSTSTGVDTTRNRATPPNPLFRIYSALRPADSYRSASRSIGTSRHFLHPAAVRSEEADLSVVATKEAILQAFSSRRPDSNRRPLHYEELTPPTPYFALWRDQGPFIPRRTSASFRICSALRRRCTAGANPSSSGRSVSRVPRSPG
jgi:hypothetical protein